ncbi:MAG: hypothetical protein NTX79_06895 [Candidatus Micrarchaeota archaeon]|nr:hypothetical protein [Candidatus Micrarchaeota archaeon]
MGMSRFTVWLIALLLLVSVFVTVYFLNANSALERKIASLNATAASTSQKLAGLQSEYSLLRQNYAQSQSELSNAESLLMQSSNRVALMQAQLLQTEAELNESRQSIAGQQQKLYALNSEFSTLESTINSSIAWFRGNAYMPKDFGFIADAGQQRVMAGFIPRIESDCVDSGSLNLACISHLMENTAFSIHYRSDTVAGSEDHLQSVKETIGLGWGDCEDYSLILKAILNSVRKDNASLSIVAWQPADSGEFRVYPKETPGESGAFWVYKNAKGAPMGSPRHAYVICYSVDAQTGHCTVALSDADVQSSNQVPSLQGAYAFEPQSGRYLGKLGESLSICTHSGCKNMGGVVWLVISDSDLYIYGENGWEGYADYLAKVEAAKAELPA